MSTENSEYFLIKNIDSSDPISAEQMAFHRVLLSH